MEDAAGEACAPLATTWSSQWESSWNPSATAPGRREAAVGIKRKQANLRTKRPPPSPPYGAKGARVLSAGIRGGPPPDFRPPSHPISTSACGIGVSLAFWGGRVLGLLSASNFFPAGTRVGCTGTAQPLRAVPSGSPRGASRAKEMRTFAVPGSFGAPRGRLGAPRGRKSGNRGLA